MSNLGRTELAIQEYRRSWNAASDDRLRFQVHTVADGHEVIGLHINYTAGGSPAFAVTLTAADAATLAGVLQDAATTAARNVEEA